MSQIVFLLEELSAQAMLEGLLPRVLPENITIRYIVFEGKQDLDKQLVRRLRGYLVSNANFIVLRDKDSADCLQLKQQLLQKCLVANKPDTLVRIACPELESWYLADLAAVEKGLELKNILSKQNQAKYRKPDNLTNACEELDKLTGYQYQKVGGSRSIGKLLDPDNTRSKSFEVFIKGLKKIVTKIQSIN